MKYWLLGFVPILLLMFTPMEVQGERLLVTGQGEVEKRFSTNETDFEMIFNTFVSERNSWLELESGSITINEVKHFMHPDSSVRDMMNHQILRIAGVLDNGNIFWIYGVKDGTNYEMFGKLFTEENKFEIKYDGTIQSLDIEPIIMKADTAPIVEYTPELAIDFKVEEIQFIQNDLEVFLTAFDSKKGIGGIRNTVGNIAGVDIKVDLAQERREYIPVDEINGFIQIVEDDWRQIVSIEGKTNEHGKWTGAQLLGSKIFQQNQNIQVTITATLGEQTVTETIEVFVSDAN
ncbi:MAG: hypothetical protein ACR2LL_11015 [Nitrosopumilus sp.]